MPWEVLVKWKNKLTIVEYLFYCEYTRNTKIKIKKKVFSTEGKWDRKKDIV